MFNFEHYFKNNFKLILTMNVLAPVVFVGITDVVDFSLTPRHRSFGGFDADFNLFNELRVGLGPFWKI